MRLYQIIILFLFVLFIFKCKPKLDNQPQTSVPVVTTTAISAITSNTAKSGGKVTYDGSASILQRGICWGINQFPTIDNNKTVNGTGAGEFSAALTGLLRATTYYVRAYATDGNGTNYGNEIKFETSSLYIVDNKGAKLYVHPVDNATLTWGPPGVAVGADSFFDGSANTGKLSLASGNYAAKTCSELVAFGYSDWYLPSKEELNILYQNRVLLGINQGIYWSSTEVNETEATAQNLQNGQQHDNFSKTTMCICRCVRKDQ